MKGSEETLTKGKEVMQLFVRFVMEKDIDGISLLLDSNGIYDIELPDQDTLEVDKPVFLEWFETQLRSSEINTVEYDQCLFCKIGNPVVIFNNGTFPRSAKVGEKPKSGIMIDVNDSGLINQIQFCFTFLHSENRFERKINANELRNKLEEGFTLSEAIRVIKYGDGSFDGECDFPF